MGTSLFFLAFLSPIIYSVDGVSMLAVAESIVTHGSLTVPSSLGMIGVGGLYYSKWYPLLSVLAVPLVALGTFFAHLLHLPPHYLAGAFALALPPVLVGATTGVVVTLALRLGASPQAGVLAAVAFAFGTIALVYAREFFAEPLLALITVVAIYLELGSRRERKFVALMVALAILAKPTGVILGPIFAAHASLKARSLTPAFGPLLGTIVGIATYFLYNYIRFGDVLTFGQPVTFKLSNLSGGLAGLVASPGRGLLWYCPVILALTGLRPSLFKRLDVLMIASIAITYLSLYSLWPDWAGGWCWGPRFLLPALPGLMAVCGLLDSKYRKALIVLLVLGFIINAPTLVSYYERVYQENLAESARPQTKLWSMREAPFLKIWGSASRELSDARVTDIHSLVQSAGETENSHAQWRTLRVVAVWWWMLPLVRIPRAIGAAFSALVAIAGLWLIRSQWSSSADTQAASSRLR